MATGATNLPRIGNNSNQPHSGSSSRPAISFNKPLRATTGKAMALSKQRTQFPPRDRTARGSPHFQRKDPVRTPAYPPLKNIHAVPTPVDYDTKLGFSDINKEKCRTRSELKQKIRRSRLPGLRSTDIDDDGVIDSTEIRLAAVMRELSTDQALTEAEKVKIGRKMLAKELISDLDDTEFYRMGKEFHGRTKEEAINMVAEDPNFRERFNDYTIKKATAKLMSSGAAKSTLQQMATARQRAEEAHAANKARHQKNIWQASRSRAAELARNINTADRFRLATEGYTSLSGYNNHLARRKDVMLPRINMMKY